MSHRTRLKIARNLARIYEDVLREPLPTELFALLRRFEEQEKARR